MKSCEHRAGPSSAPIEALESRQLLAVLPAGFAEVRVATDLLAPTTMRAAPDGRVFVGQQDGVVRVIKNDQLLPTPFADVGSDTLGERGLLGIEFDPQFASNGWVYMYYTVPAQGGASAHNRVSRFTANGDVAVPGSETVIFELPSLVAEFHNSGAMRFGEDGKLYIATGENLEPGHSQAKNDLLGKILRINKDGSIPTDNPFYNENTGNNRAVWAWGLRNPFTIDIQPGSGELFINDVGNDFWEEVNRGVAGANYGWPYTEGFFDPTDPPWWSSLTNPLFAYEHHFDTTGECAITGGAFYNPQTISFPASYLGDYFYADFCAGWIRVLDTSANFNAPVSYDFATGLEWTVGLEVAPDGSLYYMQRGLFMDGVPGEVKPGTVWRIFPATSDTPIISVPPENQRVPLGQGVTFSVTAIGPGPLRYQWQRDGEDIPGATDPTFAIDAVSASDGGDRFRVVVTNDHGTVTSAEAILSVAISHPPEAHIILPLIGQRYRGGEVITYAGEGLDEDDGELPGYRLTWSIDFHHDDHFHPFLQPTAGKRGEVTIPRIGETSSNVFFRVHLTVTDSDGLSDSTYRDIVPRKVKMNFSTSVPGINLSLDGTPRGTPFTITGVVGIKRKISAPLSRSVDGKLWIFDHWSDGKANAHTFNTPTKNTDYVAVYRLNRGSVGTGSGLTGTYYDTASLSQPKLRRTDPAVNFAWGNAAPASGFEMNSWSVRWTGRLQAQFSEATTLLLNSNDGVRLWIDGQLVINDWLNSAPGERSAAVNLTAGRRHTIRLEYRHLTGDAGVQLLWSSASMPKSIVPSSQLHPA